MPTLSRMPRMRMLAPFLPLMFTLAALAAAAPASAATSAFPKGFTWGVAMAGFQSDMALGSSLDKRSDWWSWTHDSGNIDAKRVTTDDPGNGPGFGPFGSGRCFA